MRKVIVTEYNESWPVLYEEEAFKLREVFGSLMVEVHHIGSTSVYGLCAKPILDFLVVVTDIEAVDSCNRDMVELGYVPKGENGIPLRRYFQIGGDDRTHHVHVFQRGSEEVERHLAFRDYLRTHADEAERYGVLKKALAQQFPTDMEAYIAGKDALVKEIERSALLWWRDDVGRCLVQGGNFLQWVQGNTHQGLTDCVPLIDRTK